MVRLGAVSFLNARPLVYGLDAQPDVRVVADVPAALPALLDAGRVDAGLVPIIDVLRSEGRYAVVSDACIGCDGETMTVRVFSQTPPDRIRELWVDGDSHTSVALARLLWHELYGCELECRPLDARGHDSGGHGQPGAGRYVANPATGAHDLRDCQAVLLIGDKVVDPRRAGFAYEVDLGGAWRQHTGLPFVFAVWASAPDAPGITDVSALLGRARDTGVAAAEQIARSDGPKMGWPVELAVRYLTRCLTYTLDARHAEGASLFGRLCAKYGLVPAGAQLHLPSAGLVEPAK